MRQLTIFDYGQLDAETRIVVQQRTGEIRTLMRRAAQDIVDIGLKLIEVKERLEHGRFLPWLRVEFDWDERQAQRFIAVAERFGKSDNLSDFAPSALYLLSAPSTPDDARQEALARAGEGEPITHAKAKEIVWRHTPAPAEGAGGQGDERPAGGRGDGIDENDGDLPDEPLAESLREIEVEAAARGDYEEALDCREERVLRTATHPHSDRLKRWLGLISGQTYVIHIEMGGIGQLLEEPDKWHRNDTTGYIIPMLKDLAQTITTYQREIERAFEVE